jgi:hypothetical protein
MLEAERKKGGTERRCPAGQKTPTRWAGGPIASAFHQGNVVALQAWVI